VLRIDQPFERGGKRELRMQGADLRLSAAGHDLTDARRQGGVALRQAYYDLMLTQEKLRIAEENAHLFRQSVDAAKLRLNALDIAPAELSRLTVDALRADNDVRQAQNDMQQAQAALAYMIGAERAASTLHAVDAWPAILPVQGAPFDVEKRADVRAAVARVRAAEAARDLALSLKTRDVTLGLQVERNGSNNPLHSVGLGVSIPLLTGYEYQGEIVHAESDLQAARDALEQTRAQAITEISKSRSDLEAAMERVRRFDEQLLAAATRVLESSEFAYRKGALSVMDLLDARRTYKAIQMDAAVARADYAKSLAKSLYTHEDSAQ
jgi:cobalt-zinc-cadmium efflux system outer membrane protein